MKQIHRYVLSFADYLDIRVTGKWLVYGILIGVVAGLGSVLFYYLLNLSTHFFLNTIGGYYPPFPAGEIGNSAR